MTRYELAEYDTACWPIAEHDAVSLAATKAATVTRSLDAPDQFMVTTNSHVGVVHVGDVELHIRPKVPVRRLFFLLSYTHEPTWRPEDAQLSTDADLLESITDAYCHHTSTALAQGILQGYRQRDDALHTVRGRIRVGDQMARRPGQPLPLELTFDDYTIDIDENRLLRTAATRLRRLPTVSDDHRALLRHLDHRLEGVTTLPHGPTPPIPITRLNNRYRLALTLARLICDATGLDTPPGATPATGFLVDMNVLFEDFVASVLTTALEARGGTVHRQFVNWFDRDQQVTIRPDLVWVEAGRCRAVLDTKYKRLASVAASNSDLYQALAYTEALDTINGYLIYADAPSSTHRMRHSSRRLRLIAFNLDQEPSRLLASAEELADYVARTSHDCQGLQAV